MRKYLLYRSWGNRVPVLKWVPKDTSTVAMRDMLPPDLVGKYAVVEGRSWQHAWDTHVKRPPTLVID